MKAQLYVENEMPSLNAMLKRARRELNMRKNKPIERHAAQTMRHRLPGSIPLKDVIAEMESTPAGKEAMEEGRKWVRDNFYPSDNAGGNAT